MEFDDIFWYCPRCGRMYFWSTKDPGPVCDCCQHQMVRTPPEYELTEEKDYNDDDGFEQNRQRFFDEVVSKSPEFDINRYNNIDAILKENYRKYEEMMARARGSSRHNVECPYCHATDVKRISTTSKAIHTAIFGIFSLSRNSKQWHCNNCNSDF